MTQMTTRPAPLAFLLLALHSLAACSAPSPASGPSPTPGAGYSLLYGLLAQDVHADKILWVKFESDELEALLERWEKLFESAQTPAPQSPAS